MIPDTENASSWPPVVAVAVAAVAVGGTLYLDRPLESQRPSNPSTVLEASRHPRFPLAQLWQDPLHVVYEHWRTIRDNEQQRKSVPFVTEAFADPPGSNRNEAEDDQRVLRLIVMPPGTPYSDDHERRRRQRHAVVSALTGKEFVPSDGMRLSYFRAPRFRDVPAASTAASGSIDDPMLVGYETYEPDMKPVWGRWASVEVLWLNTEDFRRDPLHKVSALVAVLDHWRHQDSGKATTVVLGPPSSDVLREMFDEKPEKMPPVVQGFLNKVITKASRRPGPSDPDRFQVRRVGREHAADTSALGRSRGLFLQEVTRLIEEMKDLGSLKSSAQKAREALRVFSHQATIPVEWLRDCRPDANAECPAVTKTIEESLGVESFYSSIADDGKVLEAVLGELVNRGACTPTRTRPTVAILSEQDTLYGRLLGNVAEHAAKQIGRREGCEIQIIEHGYIRGVDGEMPPPDEDRTRRDTRRNEPAQDRADAAGSERAVPSLPGDAFEPPFGAARLDYVRRLSERLRNGSDATPPVAIGVLGNDLYDKLLILQALRESHPGVVFFTTDMDARLLDPTKKEWTRNLIVGSAYGLSPPELESDTFRDSYQASLFFAVQQAVDWQSNRRAPEPKLFEISSTSFVPLGSQASDRDWMEVAVLLTPLAVLAVFALYMLVRQREKTARVRRRRYEFVAIFATAAAAWLYLFVQELPNTEPGPLFDGVSTVPMVMLQITTIVFAIAIVCIANGRTRHTLFHVADRLAGKPEPKGGLQALHAAAQEWRSGGMATLVSAWKQDIAGGEKGRKIVAVELWRDVSRYHEWRPRFVRIGVGLLVGLALREVYFKNARIEQPLLGQALTTPEWMTYVLPVAIFWAIAYCRDTIAAWRKFIRALGRFDVTGGNTDGKIKSKAAARAHRSMDLLVHCTDVIGPVVVMPLVLMVLLMLGRSTLFDGWSWALPLIVFHVGLSIYVLSIAVGFHREAAQAKDEVLDRLREAKLDAKKFESTKPDAKKFESTEIDYVMKYVQRRREGRFDFWAPRSCKPWPCLSAASR